MLEVQSRLTPWAVARQAPPSMANTRVGCHALLQGLKPGFLHCRQILYQLSHQRSKEIEGSLKEGGGLPRGRLPLQACPEEKGGEQSFGSALIIFNLLAHSVRT